MFRLLCALPLTVLGQPSDQTVTYAVNRTVESFPTNQDLSTPEGAYVACNRACASGEQGRWRELSVKRLAERLPAKPGKTEVRPSAAKEWLTAEVLEVQIYKNTLAMVCAKIDNPRKAVIDIRCLELEQGRWLNRGNDVAGSLDEARRLFARRCAYIEVERRRSTRPPVRSPEEHLRSYVEFLRREAADPHKFMLQALGSHRVVVLGEVHHRPRYWEFNSNLVRAAAFPQSVGVIYMELPYNDQPLVDRFLAAPTADPAPVIEMLRNILWMGWPDQPMLDFFKTVWDINQQLPKAQRLRIVLVDMQRPWKEIHVREDWSRYEVDRNQLMAENILRDLQAHEADPRHGLFIVGYLHALMNVSRPGGEPVKSAGWHLCQKLGQTNVFGVFPHSPVLANTGGVDGRLALGLFETAFAALNHQPMAFPLDRGPFGQQLFDASLDELTADSYGQAFQAYLYLGALEGEVFSPMIPGFYSEDFVKELERRSQVMFGKGRAQAHGIKTADPNGFVGWMGRSWGRVRRDWSAASLGPLNAWQFGSDWQTEIAAAKLRNWTNETATIRLAAQRLFDAIRAADYENPRNWRDSLPEKTNYRVRSDWPAWMNWMGRHFRTNPIVAVDLGEVARFSNGGPAVPYQVTLKDGAKLVGRLPMEWDTRGETWMGVEGLDWHLGGTSRK